MTTARLEPKTGSPPTGYSPASADVIRTLSSQTAPFLRLGQAPRQFTDVTGADQFAYGRVAGRRHGPVVTGCAAAPDPPQGVLAPEPVKFGTLVVPAVVGHHGGRRRATA